MRAEARIKDQRLEEIKNLKRQVAELRSADLVRQRVEEELRERNQYIQSVMDNLPIGLAINTIDDGIFRYMNCKFEEIYGWPKEIIVDVETFFLKVYPDSQFREKISERIRADMRSGDPSRMIWKDVPITRSSGEKAYVTGINIPMIEKNLMISTVMDITERKRAEQALKASEAKYRELVENASSVILRMDVEGRITFFNEFAQRFFGYSQGEIIGQKIIGTIVPQRSSTGQDLSLMMEEFRNNPERFAVTQNENIKSTGERVWVAWRNKPMFDETGSLIGWLCIGNDITQRQEAEERLLAYQDQLRALAAELSTAEDRYRRDIAADLHDRAGQQLAITKMRLGEIVEAKGLDVETKKELRAIISLVDRTMQDVESLILELHPPALQELSLDEAIEEMIGQVGEEYGLEARFKGNGRYETLHEGIRTAIYRIVRELLNNVVKHASASQVLVTMRRRKGSILVEVKDNGVGFEPEAVASSPRKRFGLFYIKERVAHFGGQCRIDSNPGEGSRVLIELPSQKSQ